MLLLRGQLSNALISNITFQYLTISSVNNWNNDNLQKIRMLNSCWWTCTMGFVWCCPLVMTKYSICCGDFKVYIDITIPPRSQSPHRRKNSIDLNSIFEQWLNWILLENLFDLRCERYNLQTITWTCSSVQMDWIVSNKLIDLNRTNPKSN